MFNRFKKKQLDFSQVFKAAENLTGRLPAIKKRRRLSRAFKILKYFSLSLAGLLIIFLTLFSLQFFSLRQIYEQAAAGKTNLEQAIIFAKNDDFSRAVRLAKTAENNFNFALNRLTAVKENFLINRLSLALSWFNRAENLLVSAEFLSKAVYGGANFGKNLEELLSQGKKLNFSKLSLAEKRLVLKKIYQSAPELNGIKADLDLAYLSLNQAGSFSPFFALNEKVEQIKEKISQASLLMATAVPLAQLIPALAGYPEESKFLIMLENSDELRPTGGFLGTYGIMRVQDGDITNFSTHDIYHLDMPVRDKINLIPPAPIRKYLNNKWYLRDANWSPDWPTAARQISWFYQRESSLNPNTPAAEKISDFDGVIGLTAKLITDFLKITGPITVEGQTYNDKNFQDLLEYRVEKGYELLGVSKWQRKEVIGEIAKELKIKIFDLPPKEWGKIIKTAVNNLSTKNLLFYFNDIQLENLAIDGGWGGEIKKYFGDYLMVVDANLAALKTDAVMSRNLRYQLSQQTDGLFAELTLDYSHHGKFDWKTSAYKSYTRVYVPLYSQLIDVSGISPGQIDIGREAGKTYFGFYFMVEPGKIANISLNYKLPAGITTGKSYGLYLQKQAGKNMVQAAVDFNFTNKIKSYSPTGLTMAKSGLSSLKWAGELETDKSFEIKF